jgi:ribonuclease VapC
MTLVLDASAVLALIFGERGSDIVAENAKGARVSAVNFSEILTRVIDKDGDPVAARNLLSRLELAIVPHDEELAAATAVLRNETRQFGLSLGDRACLALAQRDNSPVLTADQDWAKLDLGIEVRLIREPS